MLSTLRLPKAILLGVCGLAAFWSPAVAANLGDWQGRWSCVPVAPLAPKIEIDFDEAEYRRCDRHICSSYDLASDVAHFRIMGPSVEIVFAGQARFVAAIDGSHFVERIVRGAHEFVAAGSCHRQADVH